MKDLAAIPSPTTSVWHLGPVPLRAYALCIMLGMIIASVVTERRMRARGAPPYFVLDVAIWAIPLGIVGARVYSLITSPQVYFGSGHSPWEWAMIWHGGLGIWGAVAGGAGGALIACRQRGVPLRFVADALAPGLPLAQAVGRWGNWFNNELFGRPTSLPWGLKVNAMDGGQALRGPDGAPLAYDTLYPDRLYHPTFLYESVWCVGVAVLVWQVDRRFKLGRGRAFALYVMAYTAGRAWIEALRIDDANRLLGLRVNDWVSLLVFVAALVYFVRVRGPQQRLSVAEDGTVTVLDDGGADQPVPAGEPATEPEAAVAAEPDLDPPGTGDPDPAEPEAAGADAPPGDPASPGEADPPERRQPSAVPK